MLSCIFPICFLFFLSYFLSLETLRNMLLNHRGRVFILHIIRKSESVSKLWSCGTFLTSAPEQALQRGRWQFCHPITHWVTISNFKDSLSYPNDSDLSRHEKWFVMCSFTIPILQFLLSSSSALATLFSMEYCHEQEQICGQYFRLWRKCSDFRWCASIPTR